MILGNGEDYIEAKINLLPTNRSNDIKQNVLSVGQGIQEWPTTNNSKYSIHFYYPNSEKNDHLLRFSAVIGEKVNGLTRRTMGIIKIPTELVTIRIDCNGIKINGHYVENFKPNTSYHNDSNGLKNALQELKDAGNNGNYKYVSYDDRPLDTYQYFIEHYLSSNEELSDMQVGCIQGKSRSYAHYDYVMVSSKYY